MIDLGSIRGTRIRLEISFLILVGFFVLMYLEGGAPLREALLWVPILFISVLIHELGHAATIGMLGLGSSLVTLGGFGGATYNDQPRKPWQQLVISLAGPLAGFILAGLCWLLWVFTPALASDPMLAVLFPYMIAANVYWGILNLIPAHPMDGGQAVHAGLHYVTTPINAFRISTWTSIVLSGALFVVGLILSQFLLMIIAGLFLMENWRRMRAIGKSDEHESEDEPR